MAPSASERAKQKIRRLAAWSIIVAFGVMGLKFVAWWMTGSVALYSDALVTFEDDRGAYDQKDAEGFIRLNGLRLRTLAARKRKG